MGNEKRGPARFSRSSSIRVFVDSTPASASGACGIGSYMGAYDDTDGIFIDPDISFAAPGPKSPPRSGGLRLP
jgi:hypothetical protein